MEPPVSVPRAHGASPAATAAAEPPLDPPATRSRSWGFLVTPKAEYSEDEPMANSSRLVLPKMGRPALRTFSTTAASKTGTYSAKNLEAQVVRKPMVEILSFTAMGIPSQGERASPRARRRSASRAWASASSPLQVIKALIWGSASSILVKYCLTNSSLEICLFSNNAAVFLIRLPPLSGVRGKIRLLRRDPLPILPPGEDWASTRPPAVFGWPRGWCSPLWCHPLPLPAIWHRMQEIGSSPSCAVQFPLQ